MTFANLVEAYGKSARQKLAGPGQREALLVTPISNFIEGVGGLSGLSVTAHDEVSEFGGTVRPDFGVRVGSALIGHIELKAPGESLDPKTYGITTHNYRQWQRLRELPNLLHTNGIEFRLWRYGVLVGEPVHLHSADLASHRGPLHSPERLELVINQFLQWEPAPILTVSRLVETLAPLARLLREEVHDAVRAERKAIRTGESDPTQLPFTGVANDWRALLFPGATDAQFADGFAQTVVFALLLALSEGVDLSSTAIEEISSSLSAHHTLMGRALRLLTEHIAGTTTWNAIETVIRVLSATKWDSLGRAGDGLYLHLYEDFLAKYDPQKRELSGSYYTPVEIVDGMVRLTDEILRSHLGKPEGFRNPNVSIVDPAMGTGTFPLSILRKVGNDAEKQYGPGARPEAISSAVARMYGIEIQTGPFSVAELRLSAAIEDAGANQPEKGMNLYVADTLEDPSTGINSQLSYTASLIAQQRHRANRMKRERNVQVCIGNPPYDDHAGGRGGWIEAGIDQRTGSAPLDAFKLTGNGKHERHLSNMYSYFWRWATWKIFESTSDPDVTDGSSGIVTFITATGYLAGPGFKGMRKYLREACSHGWIINLTPEGKLPPKRNAVFNIETPVAIGIFARAAGTETHSPASIEYIDLHGTKEEKFEQLLKLTTVSPGWRPVRNDWTAPFTPASRSTWDSFPATDDLFPFRANGIMAGRGWAYSPSDAVLEARLRELINEPDRAKKSALFKDRPDTNISRAKKPLPGTDTEPGTATPLDKISILTSASTVSCGFRFLDRQFVIADSRVLSRPSPNLWLARIPEQSFAIELHSETPRRGPGLVYSALIPDVHYFRGSGGGRALPRMHPNGSPNLPPGLLSALQEKFSRKLDDDEVFAYAAGIAGHPDFVARFDDDLSTPGIRIPITADASLWSRGVALGRHTQWLHTYGMTGRHPAGLKDIRDPGVNIEHPIYAVAVGNQIPADWSYDAECHQLYVGEGRWDHVPPDAVSYEVGGARVLDSWLGYRLASPKKKITSPLDSINALNWEASWSQELSALLSILIQLRSIEVDMANLLGDIMASPLITRDALQAMGVTWPSSDVDRSPRTL